MSKEAMKLALEALTATMSTHGFRKHIEEAQDKAIKALEEALTKQEQLKMPPYLNASYEGDDLFTGDQVRELLAKQEQGEPVALEPAPKNSLPTFKECRRIITNHEFRERAKAGLEGQVLDTPRTTPTPTALHRFIYEYDDADPYKSAWFMHRLECVLKEAITPQQRKPLTDEQVTQLWAHIQEPSLRKALTVFARAIEAAHGIKE